MGRRHAHVEEAEINITPMLDIVFSAMDAFEIICWRRVVHDLVL